MIPGGSGSEMQSTSEQPIETVFHFGAPVIRFSVGDSDNEQDVTGALPCTSAQQIRVTSGRLSDAEGHALDPFVARKFGWSVSVIFCSPFPLVDNYRFFFSFFFFFAFLRCGTSSNWICYASACLFHGLRS